MLGQDALEAQNHFDHLNRSKMSSGSGSEVAKTLCFEYHNGVYFGANWSLNIASDKSYLQAYNGICLIKFGMSC